MLTAIADACRAARRHLGSEPLLWHVTASLEIDDLTPTPIPGPVDLRARVREAKGRKRVVTCTLRSGDTGCARAGGGRPSR